MPCAKLTEELPLKMSAGIWIFRRQNSKFGRKNMVRLGASEACRLFQLEDENARLNRLVVDLTLDKNILQEVTKKRSKAGPQTRACCVD
jgi:hypothetical protein